MDIRRVSKEQWQNHRGFHGLCIEYRFAEADTGRTRLCVEDQRRYGIAGLLIVLSLFAKPSE